MIHQRRRFLARAPLRPARRCCWPGCERLSQNGWFPQSAVRGGEIERSRRARHRRRARRWRRNSPKRICRPTFRSNGTSRTPTIRRLPGAGRQWLRRLSAAGRWRGMVGTRDVLRSAELRALPSSHADHAPRLRRRLERDRANGRVPSSARCSTPSGLKPRGALCRVPLRRSDGGGRHRFLLREHRPGGRATIRRRSSPTN